MSSKSYFIQARKGGPIKIGKSSDVEVRLRDLQVGNPNELIVLGTSDVPEEELHGLFHSARLRGEWFDLSAHLMAYLREKGITFGPSIPHAEHELPRDESLGGIFELVEGDWYHPEEIDWLRLIVLGRGECQCEEDVDDPDDEDWEEWCCDRCLAETAFTTLESLDLLGFVWNESQAVLVVLYQRDAFGRRASEITNQLVDVSRQLDDVGAAELLAFSYSTSRGFRQERL